MKKLLLLCSLVFTSHVALANIGAGVVLGDPTGFSFEYSMGSKNTLALGLAWDLQDKSRVHLHGDYLWKDISSVKLGNLDLRAYAGLGPRIVLGDELQLGLRAPVGLEYSFPQPFKIFFELAPVIDIIQSTDLDFNLGLGARYYF